jgi:hypothetical protein
MAIVKKKPAPATPPKVTRAKKTDAVAVVAPVVHVSAFKVGSRVSHPSFGDGTVTAVVRDQLTIKFAGGEKVILDSYVKASAKG